MSTILIEGLDLAGKSTLVRELSKSLRDRGIAARVCSNSLCANNPIHAFTEPLRGDPRFGSLEGNCLMLAAHIWDARNFVPQADGIHVQDSCWLQSAAYEGEFGSPDTDAVWVDCPQIRFDRALFLTASMPARLRRLRAYQQNHWLLEDPVRFCRLECRLLDMVSSRFPTEILDTSHLTVPQMVSVALRLLELESTGDYARVA